MSLGSVLAPYHHVLLQHYNILAFDELRELVECYGEVLDISSYCYGRKELISVVQFKDPASVELCYESLRSYTNDASCVISRVALIYGESLTIFASKDYVGSLSERETRRDECSYGYLVVYLSHVSGGVRSAFADLIKKDGNIVDYVLDLEDKERCFLCYASMIAAEDSRRALSIACPELKKNIYYCNENDFSSAKQKLL
ncbi:unnamed protein product [Trypanosoma congolense IL3000]|uniref:WGS project CAEQ00000000 data, annotated contig 1973 n=1 Tax=Trypanosoma congolense (strain IL3000) TaxID=1068625 RepID=F9WAH2_TRYCI|nr:unnamed protein product [Trypanosoma congolense IL3000]